MVVNFNTVFLKVNSNRRIISAEKQTPLTSIALELGQKLKIGKHRIRIPNGLEIPYAGELIKEIFREEGISFNSSKLSLQTIESEDVFLYTHFNEMTISQIISGMMLYSNNFTANQLLLRIGLKRYGPPASLNKGNQAIKEYLVNKLKIPSFLSSGVLSFSKNKHKGNGNIALDTVQIKVNNILLKSF